MVPLQFSAMHSIRRSGKWKCISAGASLSGAIWNTRRTPSTTSSWPVRSISTVGAISPDAWTARDLPSPQSTWPRSPAGSSSPYM